MGRPRTNDTESAGLESGNGDQAEAYMQQASPHAVGSPVPQPYAPTTAQAPYPPVNSSGPQDPSVVSGTPVSFPPMTPKHYAVTPSTLDGGTPLRPPSTPQVGRPWASGLFDCDQDQTNAIMTAFFPCVTFGQIAEILDEGETSCTLGSFMYILMAPALCTCWILGSNYRQRLRKKYNLVEAPAEDWTVHLFCPCCSLCQEYRELQKRGIDPSLGWMGYLAQQQETTTAPPKTQSMSM